MFHGFLLSLIKASFIFGNCVAGSFIGGNFLSYVYILEILWLQTLCAQTFWSETVCPMLHILETSWGKLCGRIPFRLYNVSKSFWVWLIPYPRRGRITRKASFHIGWLLFKVLTMLFCKTKFIKWNSKPDPMPDQRCRLCCFLEI